MNARVVQQAFKSAPLRRKILAVLFMLFLYRVLAHIPVPIGEAAQLRAFMQSLLNSQQLVGLVDLFSGGALSNFSIVLLGIGPYINASIIMQVLMYALPNLKELQKEGEHGRQKINQYTRLLSLPLAAIQSVATVFLIRRLAAQLGQTVLLDPPLSQWLLIITVLTAGSLLLMWMGELITEKGIGNGISILVFASIISGFPGMFGQLGALVRTNPNFLPSLLGFVAAALAVTYFVVKLNEAQRKVTISYAKRVSGSRMYGGVESTLPIRVLTAGVIPIIFAVAFLSVPTFLSQLLAGARTQWLSDLAVNLGVWFAQTHVVYMSAYFALVVAFTYFYTNLAFNSKDISENLQKQGGFIPGIRPGTATARFLRKIVNRITLFGALSLGLLAILPFVAQRVSQTNVLTLGGTSVLIVVSVAIETLRQLEAQTVMSSYE